MRPKSRFQRAFERACAWTVIKRKPHYYYCEGRWRVVAPIGWRREHWPPWMEPLLRRLNGERP